MGSTMDPDGGTEPIAIVGMAFEFPGDATTEDAFWRMILDGECTSSEFPPDRLNIDGFYHLDKTRNSTFTTRGGHFVKAPLGAFDAAFFSLSPGEAACLDPQQRRVLETTYHALENAGIPMSKCSGSATAVYTGTFTKDYSDMLQMDYEGEQRHAGSGTSAAMIANRLSWFFNFTGPSVNVDTACSSSLVALHLACQDLKNGTADMGVVGGTNYVFHPEFMKRMSNYSFLSPTSHCWSFDERADGYARGEGTAVIIVKRLSDAIRDGNHIRAVIRGTGLNQDGRTPSVTAPSGEVQRDLIKKTYALAGVDMAETKYFECHGTGTRVGDPTEVSGIAEAFSGHISNQQPLHVGSVKANIGHLEGASGLAGLIKTVLMLERSMIPPIANLRNLNRSIDPEALCLAFPRKPTPWPSGDVRRACVNSFGFGGANATVILDNWDSHHCNGANGAIKPSKRSLPYLLVSSGFDKVAASIVSQQLQEAWTSREDHDQIASTLATSRTHLPWRSFAIAWPDSNVEKSWISQPPQRSAREKRLAVVFSGQGAQYVGMGKELMRFPVFRHSILSMEENLFQLQCPWSLQESLLATGKDLSIDDPSFAQPLSTCLQIGLVDLMFAFGIRPAVVVGHSSGEIAAAYAAGGLSRRSAVRVSYLRGVLSSKLANKTAANTKGMMAVGLSKQDANAVLKDFKRTGEPFDVSVGCINSPTSVTLTGSSVHLEIVEKKLQASGIFARRLRTPISYHSSYMNNIADDYIRAMGKLEPGARRIPMISSVTGDAIVRTQLTDPKYWARNMTCPVEFNAAFHKLTLKPSSGATSRKRLGGRPPVLLSCTDFLELGPHSTLRGPVQEILRQSSEDGKRGYVSSLVRGQNAVQTMMSAVGTLHCSGVEVDLLAVNGLTKTSLAPNLPKYPFNHSKQYWEESRLSRNFRMRKHPRHDLLGTPSMDWNPDVAVWRNVIRTSEVLWLQDHAVQGAVIMPAAGMIVMAIEAIMQLQESLDISAIEVEDVSFNRPLEIPMDTGKVDVQVTMTKQGSSTNCQPWRRFQVFVMGQDTSSECCSGLIKVIEATEGGSYFRNGESCQSWMANASAACSEPQDSAKLYELIEQNGLQFGPSFKCMKNIRTGQDARAFAHIPTEQSRVRDTGNFSQPYLIHPATLDGILQLIAPSKHQDQEEQWNPSVVSSLSRLRIDATRPASFLKGDLQCFMQCTSQDDRQATASAVAVTNESSTPILIIEGYGVTTIDTASPRQIQDPRLCMQVVSKPDISLASCSQIHDYCVKDRPVDDIHTLGVYKARCLVMLSSIDQTLELIQPDRPHLPAHSILFCEWMERQRKRCLKGELCITEDQLQGIRRHEDRRLELYERVRSTDDEGALLVVVGQSLAHILRGDVDALDLLFQSGLVDSFYQNTSAASYAIHPAKAYVDLLCHKNPSLSVLEVGAGTGGFTKTIMDSVWSGTVRKWSRYDYTDLSLGFFQQAQEKLGDFADGMEFRILNITDDPVAQGFGEAKYDLVIAFHVLHATNDLEKSLKNIRKLLRPSGKLLIVETVDPDNLPIGFAFGILKDWWSPLQHDKRSYLSPVIATAEWDRLFKANGFSGVDLEFHGEEVVETRRTSTLITTAQDTIESPKLAGPLTIVFDETINSQFEIASQLQTQVESATLVTLDQVRDSLKLEDTASSTSFLVELDNPFFEKLDQAQYDFFHTAIMASRYSLWVSRTSKGVGSSLAVGLGHTLASEDTLRKWVTIDLDGERASNNDEVGNLLLSLLRDTMSFTHEDMETSYTEKSGLVFVERLTESREVDHGIAQNLALMQQEEVKLHGGKPLLVSRTSTGGTSSLRFLEVTTQPEPLYEGEITVVVKAIGISKPTHGAVSDDNIVCAAAGVVEAVGTKSKLQPGDRVCVVGSSAGRTKMQIHHKQAVQFPENVTFSEAAAMTVPLMLAYYGLVRRGDLQKGEFVLNMDATSPLGQMAIQIANAVGAVTLIAGSVDIEIHDGLRRATSIGNKVTSSAIRAATNGNGIDVCFGPMSDDDLNVISHSLAPFGRFIEVSSGGQKKGAPRSPKISSQSVTTISINTSDLLTHGLPHLRKSLQEVSALLKDHNFTCPLPLQTFAANELDAAWETTQQRVQSGQVVIELEPDITVQALSPRKPPYTLPSDAIYIIAGGFGGLGRTFMRWLADRGARNLVVLSRSGVKSKAAKELVQELQQLGVRIEAPCCDIGKVAQLEQLLKDIFKSMPPIKGCIQSTMALRDAPFPKMTFEDWDISVSSKVRGSWNLHKLLPRDLDFFVLISSISGILGNRGQANYAAGNTYMDALAHHRVRQGQKGVSIDVGLMAAAGAVAENETLQAQLRRYGFLIELTPPQLLAVLEHYCNPSLPIPTEENCQVVMGIELPEAIERKGAEIPHWYSRPMFRHLFQIRENRSRQETQAKSDINHPELLRTTTTMEEASSLAISWLKAKLVQALGVDEEVIDAAAPAHLHGVDSLIAIDVKNWLEREIGAEVPIVKILGGTSLQDLAGFAVKTSAFCGHLTKQGE